MPITRRTTLVCRIGSVSVAAVVLGACATDTFDVRSGARALPATFATASTAFSTAPTRRADWWTTFGSKELDRLVAAANADNLDVAVARAQLTIAERQLDVARAGLWPTMTFSDTNTRSVSGRGSASNTLSRGLSASYMVDIWGKTSAGIDAAEHSATASAFHVEVVRIAVVSTVVDSYFIYVANRARAAMAQRNLTNAERVRTVIQQREAAGTASAFDVAQQGTLVEGQRAALPGLRQGAESARIALAQAMGQPVQAISLTIDSLDRIVVPTVAAGVPSQLLLSRPDIRAAEADLAAANADVAAARAALFPTIQINGSSSFTGASLATLLRPEAFAAALTGGLLQTVFDGGRRRAEVAVSEARRASLLQAYRRTILNALTDAEAALVAARETAAREKAQAAVVDLARRAFRLGEERLRQGTTDLTTLLATQGSLFQAEDQWLQARLARLQATVRLYQSLGGRFD